MMEERAAAAVAAAASSCRPLGSGAGPGPTGAALVSAPAPGPGPAAKGGGGGAGSPGPAAGPEPLSLPGILHFIQHEWARFEAEKARWEAERAELQAQVAFLQGERKGQENLKTDLVRRIKMLEYALKQERAKYHKLKFGTDLNQGEKKPELSEPVSNGPVESVTLENSPLVWKEGRQLLRQYLEEVGYTDTILDMRSKRVRALLGRSLELNGAPEPSEGGPRAPPAPGGLSGGESLLVKQIEEQIKRNAAGKDGRERLGGSVLEQIPFLQHCEDDDSDEDDELDGAQHRKQRVKLPSKALAPETEDEDEEDDSEDAISEFDFLGSGEDGEGPPDPRRCATEGAHHELESRRVKLQGILADLRDVDGLPPKVTGPPPGTPQPRPHEGSFGFSSDVFIMDTIGGGEVSLGDLADLTVTNDNDLSCDLSDSKDAFKKTWNPKFTLRSHYDGIRSLAFHHSQSALLTASEDGTLKLWNLQKAVTAKKNAALDVEPIHAFRAHRGPVLAVAMGSHSEYCYSGGADARIHSWKIPDLNMDPYDGYDPSVLSHVLEGHGDAVWGLAFSPASQRLASCSADGSVRIWDPSSSSPTCLCTFSTASDHGTPTSVAFTSTEPAHIVASFRSGDTVLYDLEAGSALLTLDSRGNSGPTQINQVVSHPSQPLTITAHDDRGIRFLDNRTGKSVHSMVAHLDAVTCLAVDPNGVFLMSGSHDCSLRLWSLDNKTCVQEITAHRKKHEEAIHAVACHPSKALIASAGADALAKVTPASVWRPRGPAASCLPWGLVVLSALSPGGPSHGLPPGVASFRNRPPAWSLGIFPLPWHPLRVSELPSREPHIQAWVPLGLNFSKTPEGAGFSFGTPDCSSPPPWPQVGAEREAPQTPALGLLGPWSQLQAEIVLPVGASLSPPACPVIPLPSGPSAQLSRHYPGPPGPVTAWGAGVPSGERPTLPPPTLLQGQPPKPPWGRPWGER